MPAFDVIQDIYISFTCSPSNHIATPLLLSAFERALNSLAQALESHLDLSSQESSRLPIQTLSDLFSFLIKTTYPVAFAKLGSSIANWSTSDSVDQMTGHLLTSVLIPVIHAFPCISNGVFTSYLGRSQPKARCTALTHLRSAMLGLFRKLINDLRSVFTSKSLPPCIFSIFGNLLRSISLEASTILAGLDDLFSKYNPEHVAREFSNNLSQPKIRRISRLAAKDTAWYLCSMLLICTENAVLASNTKKHSENKQKSSSHQENSESHIHSEQEYVELREKLLRDQSLASIASSLNRLTPSYHEYPRPRSHNDSASPLNNPNDSHADTIQGGLSSSRPLMPL
jgi:hypothetical protein